MKLIHSLRRRPRLISAVVLGIILAFALPHSVPAVTRGLLAWDTGVWTYLLLLLRLMRRANQRHVQLNAKVHADSMVAVLLLAVVGAMASLGAIAQEQSMVKAGQSALQGWPYLVLAITTVVGSWLLLPVEFTLAYASLYHRGENCAHGLEFPGDDKAPDYMDFMYFSITLAATSQTSDVAVSSRPMRRLVMVHALLSFVFNTCVLALTINILAGLVN